MGILKCVCSPVLSAHVPKRKEGKSTSQEREKKKTNRKIFRHEWRQFHEMCWTKFVRLCHIPYHKAHKASGIDRHTTCHSLIWIGAAELIFEVDIERISRKSSFLSIGDGVPTGNTTHITQHGACKVRTRFVKFWVTHAVLLGSLSVLGSIPLGCIARAFSGRRRLLPSSAKDRTRLLKFGRFSSGITLYILCALRADRVCACAPPHSNVYHRKSGSNTFVCHRDIAVACAMVGETPQAPCWSISPKMK